MTEYVTISQISEAIGLDRSNARKFALKNGFAFSKIRTQDSRNQPTLALTKEDAESLYELRRNQGYKSNAPIENGDGFFYAVQLLPDVDPHRIKLGWTSNTDSRLSAYRTVAPKATLLKSWLCKSAWERAAIASVSRKGCQQIGQELFVCDNVKELVKRCDEFFSIMP